MAEKRIFSVLRSKGFAKLDEREFRDGTMSHRYVKEDTLVDIQINRVLYGSGVEYILAKGVGLSDPVYLRVDADELTPATLQTFLAA